METIKKVGVQVYRDEIRHLEDILHTHHHACVGVHEQVNNARAAQRVRDTLTHMQCPRAKTEDHTRRDNALLKADQYIDKYLGAQGAGSSLDQYILVIQPDRLDHEVTVKTSISKLLFKAAFVPGNRCRLVHRATQEVRLVHTPPMQLQ